MRKIALIAVLAAILALGLSGVALADTGFTPADIYSDWTDNGVLDNTYTNAELQDYLNSALTDQYIQDSDLQALVERMLASSGTSEGTFPFTGAQLTLMIVGAAALVGIGVGIRRLARPKA